MQWVGKQTIPPGSRVQNTFSNSEPSACAGYIWEGTVSDLIELAVAIFKMELIRKPSGKPVAFVDITRAMERLFDIKIPNIYSRKTRAMERKKTPSPLLERMLAVYKHEVEKMYM